MKTLIKISCLLLILLSGCQKQISYSNYDDFLSYKKPFILPEETLDIDVITYSQDELEILEGFNDSKPSFPLDTKDLLDDVEDLKWMIRTFYGRYLLYEDAFEEAFIKIEDEITSSQMNGRGELITLLLKYFDFNQDLHFTFDGYTSLQKQVNIYDMTNSYDIIKNQAIHTDTSEVLTNTRFLVPFFELDGSIVYREKNNFSNNNSVVESSAAATSLNLEVPYFHLKEFTEHNNAFDQFSKTINNSEVSVIDLRDNSGGYQYYPGYWMSLLTDNELLYSSNGYMRNNPRTMNIFELSSFSTWFGLKDRGSYLEFVASDQILKRDGIIIVLQNGKTASAAEQLIDYLHHLDNTLFIGTPTYGSLSSNLYAQDIYLKKTGIEFSFGDASINFNPDYFAEGQGFEPDLYVLNEDLNQTINALIEKFNDK